MRALRGIVRLQALVRGRRVRKQLAVTLKCMNALVRVQERARDRRARVSADARDSHDVPEVRRDPVREAEVYTLQVVQTSIVLAFGELRRDARFTSCVNFASASCCLVPSCLL